MRALVTGSRGRMGQSIINQLKNKTSGYFEINREAPLDKVDAKAGDIVIDFTQPDFFKLALGWATEKGIPFVSGTTDLKDEHFEMLKESGLKIPVLWAPNMSLGIATMNNLIKRLSQVSEQFDFQLEEFHHIKKKDKPSGTAKFLQKTMVEMAGRPMPDVLAGRGGGIFGIHKLWMMSEEETLTIEHTALNRDVFAKGAIICAEWLLNKSSGEYNIDQVLGF